GIRLWPTVLVEVAPKFDKQLARAVRSRLKLIEDLLRRLVAEAQLVFIDERVVNPVDCGLAKLAVEHSALELIVCDPMAKAQPLEEILIDHVRAGGNDRIHHVVADHIDKNLL